MKGRSSRTSSVTDLSQLREQYNIYLINEGVEADACRGDFLKARLQGHFGDRLSFHHPRRRNLAQFVFSSRAAPGPLIELCTQLTADAEKRMEDGEDMSVSDMPDTNALSQMMLWLLILLALCTLQRQYFGRSYLV